MYGRSGPEEDEEEVTKSPIEKQLPTNLVKPCDFFWKWLNAPGGHI